MNPLDYQFHRAQARLKSKTLLALTTRFRGQKAVAPTFYVPLVGIEAVTNEDRMHEYRVKQSALNACRVDENRLSAARRQCMKRIAMNRLEDRRKAA